MPTWPATLPAPALNSVNETPPKNRLRSQMDKGPPKERRRTTANVRPISFLLKCTPAETQILDDFFVTETASGVNEFSWTHPRTGAAVVAKFSSEPTYKEFEAAIWECSIQLEVQP